MNSDENAARESKTAADDKTLFSSEQTMPARPGPGNPPASSYGIEKGARLLDLYNVESDAFMGGMGRVFRVHHTGWNISLALKQPHSHLFRTDAQKAMFTRECESWIGLGLHPHTVSCYYVREIDGVPSIFSEWMDGWRQPKGLDCRRAAVYRRRAGTAWPHSGYCVAVCARTSFRAPARADPPGRQAGKPAS